MPTKAAIQRARDRLAVAFWGDETSGGLNAVRNLIHEALETAPTEPPPPPPVDPSPPPKPVHDSFGGTYTGHDLAFDLYDNGYCGPHSQHAFLAPKPGQVQLYSFVAPLSEGEQPQVMIDDGEHEQVLSMHEVRALFNDGDEGMAWVAFMEALAHYLYIAVYTPTGGDTLPDGTRFVALGLGHIDPTSVTRGGVKTGGVICRGGMSGLEALAQWEPSHTHLTVYRTGQLSPNGDYDGVWAARYFGFDPLVVPVPGPTEYLSGQFFRGRVRTDWERSCGT